MSRDVVLAAAKSRFAADGYEKTTLRAVATDARVDPAMVLYLFGSKQELFRESLRLIIDPAVLVAALQGPEADGDPDVLVAALQGPDADGDPDVGARMVRTYLGVWEAPETGDSMRAMLASATSNTDAREAFRSFMQSYVLAAVSEVLGGGSEARLRASLAGSSLVGVAMLRYLMSVPPLSELPADDVVRLVAPAVTRYLTADADELGLPT